MGKFGQNLQNFHEEKVAYENFNNDFDRFHF